MPDSIIDETLESAAPGTELAMPAVEIAEAEVPVSAPVAREQESRTMVNLLVTTSTVLLILGWLLPWFVEPISSGVGFSPQDAVLAFVGPESIALWLVGIAFLVLLWGAASDAAAASAARRRAKLHTPQPGWVAVARGLTQADATVLALAGVLLFLAGPVAIGNGGAEALGILLVAGSVALWQTSKQLARGSERGRIGLIGLSALEIVVGIILLIGGSVFAGVLGVLFGVLIAAALLFPQSTRQFIAAGGVWEEQGPGPLTRRWQALSGSGTGRFIAEVASLRVRAIAALVGAVCTVLIREVVTSQVSGHTRRVDTMFGALDRNAVTDNAVWLTLGGFLIAAFVFLAHSFVLRRPNLALALVALVFGGLVPFIFSGPGSQEFVDLTVTMAIYTLLALGLNVVVGFAGLLDLGYAAFFAIGAYACAWLTGSQHGLRTIAGLPSNFILPFWVVLFLGATIAALFGVALGAPTLRLRGDYLAIVTLGFGEIIPDMARNNFLGQTGGPNGLTGVPAPTLNLLEIGIGMLLVGVGALLTVRLSTRMPATWRQAGLVIAAALTVVSLVVCVIGIIQLFRGPWTYAFAIGDPRPYYWALLVLIAFVILGLRNLERSRLGRAWVAIREDEVAAAATGINTVTTKLLAFSMGATVSGFAGAFYGAQLGLVTPESFGFAVSVTALSTVVLGGIGNIAGVAFGAVLVTFVIFWVLPHAQGWTQTVSTTTGVQGLGSIDFSKYSYIVYGAILISIMLLRPSGLLPSTARKVELTTGTESEALVGVQGVA